MDKLLNWRAPNYDDYLIPNRKNDNNARNKHVSFFNCRKDASMKSFIQNTIDALYELDAQIRNSMSASLFETKLLSSFCPLARPVFQVIASKTLKLLTHLKLGLSSQGCVNSLCTCSLAAGDISYYSLHRLHYTSFYLQLVS